PVHDYSGYRQRPAVDKPGFDVPLAPYCRNPPGVLRAADQQSASRSARPKALAYRRKRRRSGKQHDARAGPAHPNTGGRAARTRGFCNIGCSDCGGVLEDCVKTACTTCTAVACRAFNEEEEMHTSLSKYVLALVVVIGMPSLAVAQRTTATF